MNSPLARKLATALALDDRLLADSLRGEAVDDLIADIIDDALAEYRISETKNELIPQLILIPDSGHPSDFLQN